MANIIHLTAGLPVVKDGTVATGSNKLYVTAGLPAYIIEEAGEGFKVNGFTVSKINGFSAISKINGVSV